MYHITTSKIMKSKFANMRGGVSTWILQKLLFYKMASSFAMQH